MLRTLREQLRTIDGRVPVLSMKTMRQHVASDVLLWTVRTGANVLTVFGSVAVFLAVIGLYGVKAYVVSRRTREIGIRMAMGATSRDVVWMVIGEGAALTGAGVLVGLLLAAGVARLLASMLYEVSPFDPAVFAAGPLLLAVASLVASCVPALRATRVVPIRALRTE